MKRVITYGAYDLLHCGHIHFLRRAKALGDYLVVALCTDEMYEREKGTKCFFPYERRKELLESLRFVDLVIPQNTLDQKQADILEYHIDTLVMGEEHAGTLEYLLQEDPFLQIVYLPRTPDISSTSIKEDLASGQGQTQIQEQAHRYIHSRTYHTTHHTIHTHADAIGHPYTENKGYITP